MLNYDKGDIMMHMMDGMMGGQMSGGMMLWMGVLWLVWLALGSFVFSWIFWKTHEMVTTKKKR